MNKVILLVFLVGLSSWCSRSLGPNDSGGPPAFANNSSVSGLAFFSTKHFVISECVLFHFGTKPEVSKFSREKRLDSRVAKEVVLVSVQFHGGFLLLWFF